RLQPGGRVKLLAFSPDGQRLVSAAEADSANHVCVWDVATGRELRRVDLPRTSVLALSWLADGRGFAVLKLDDSNYFVWHFSAPNAAPPAAPAPPGGGRRMGPDASWHA